MCGIAGILNEQGPASQEAVERMVARMRHRGPDDSGAEVVGRCGLGHARLSVIDPETGHQPMASEDGAVRLVCNGEIYNFRELRKELEDRGHTFRTQSDNEVIVHLYEEQGPECVAALDGMFAFVLWDEPNQRLLLARDRLGEKPLVYHRGGSFFAFASELGGLTALDGVPRVIDPVALDLYMAFLAVPSPRTIYRDVYKLPPAHHLILEGDELRLERYWSVEPAPEDMTLDEAADAVRAAVERAVRSRLVSDVPIGAFLSGGIDSSIVVGLMSGMCDDPVRTFSIGFGDREYDELEHARTVAAEFGTDHTAFEVTPDAVEILPLLARHYGEPFADPSAVPTCYLARMTSEHVKVALTGDGADESFGGYPRHLAARACGRIDRTIPSIAWLLGRLGSFLPTGRDRKSRLTRARLLLGAMHLAPAERHAAWLSYSSEPDRRALYTSALTAALADGPSPDEPMRELYARSRVPGDPATAAMFADLNAYLPNDPLVKGDIATMANGLEVRAPLLDHRVVELAFRIPSEHKLRGGRGKRVLRHAFRDLLPESVRSRRKMGFGVPIARWLREDLGTYVEETLLGSETVLPHLFHRERIRRLLDEHTAGKTDHAYTLWSLLCFELWAREYAPDVG